MRVNTINSYGYNINFGKFLDNNGKKDNKAEEIAEKAVKEGRLSKGDFNILKNTDIVHIRSKGGALKGKPNEEALKGIKEKYTKLFWKRATPERLENMQEGNKLAIVATGVEAMLEAIDNDLNPDAAEKEAKEKGVNKELQQELRIFFDRAF